MATSVLVGIRLAVGWRRGRFAVFTGTVVPVGDLSTCFSGSLALSYGLWVLGEVLALLGSPVLLDVGCVDRIGVLV
jgi:hypothetical protein